MIARVHSRKMPSHGDPQETLRLLRGDSAEYGGERALLITSAPRYGVARSES